MVKALQQLGFKSYHFREAVVNKHLGCWREALNAKIYNKGDNYGPREFHKLLHNYNAVTDAPCVNFSEELLAAYPEARVILTTRDPQTWLASMESSYYNILSWRGWPFLRWLHPGIPIFSDVLHLILEDWTSGEWNNRSALLAGAEAHNANIREIVPAEKLLEFRVQEGWEPLCKFLNVEIPDEPFPRENIGRSISQEAWLGVYSRMTAGVAQKAKWAIPLTILGVSWLIIKALNL